MIVHVLNVKQQRILFKIIDGFGANHNNAHSNYLELLEKIVLLFELILQLELGPKSEPA